MNVIFKRIDKSLPLPSYATKGSVAFDLYTRKNIQIKPGEIKLLPTNLILKIPKGHTLLISLRSSSPKKGLLIPHGIGVIDQDYCGELDELKIQVYNFKEKSVIIRRGERIAQALWVKIAKPRLIEKEKKLRKESRGGFGSTG